MKLNIIQGHILRTMAGITVAVLIYLANGAGAVPQEQWNNTFGGTDNDLASSVVQTSDGGYVMAGQTNSFGSGEADAWLVKTDADGTEIWNRTFGGALIDLASSVVQTSDGGYVLAGQTSSFGSGEADAWLIKTNADGSENWSMTFGGKLYDAANSVGQTSDGGFILAGETFSFSDGIDKAWLIKTDVKGIEQWNMTLGGGKDEGAQSVQQTSDNGYILAGTVSDDQTDALIIKTDVNGNEQWNKTFGGTLNDFAMSVRQTSDGGYILAGVTFLFGEGSNEAWLIKISGEGSNGDLNDNGIPADAGDLVLMKRASTGEIPADTRYDMNNNGQFADAGDLVLMKRASTGEIII